MSDTIRITFDHLNDGGGRSGAREIDRAVRNVGATIAEKHGIDYVIDFPSHDAALSFLVTGFPDRDAADYDAIIAAGNSTHY